MTLKSLNLYSQHLKKKPETFLSLLRFCVINAGVLYVYFSSFQQIDEEDYGGTWELTKEGFMTSFALFLVRAILSNPEWIWGESLKPTTSIAICRIMRWLILYASLKTTHSVEDVSQL